MMPRSVVFKNLPRNARKGNRLAWNNEAAVNDVFTNAIGSRGHAAMSPALDAASGMNPYDYPANADVAKSAAKATWRMVEDLKKMAAESQVHEGGRTVVKHNEGAINRDKQSLGLPHDPRTVEQALRWTSQRPARVSQTHNTGERMRRVGPTSYSGMTSTHQRALAEVLGNKGPAAMDTLVLPSRLETFGNVIAEAHAHGRPAVARVGDFSEATSVFTASSDLIEDGVTGFLVDPHDPSDLGAALVQMAGDPAMAKEMGAVARQRAASYTWEDAADRYLQAMGLDRPAAMPLRQAA